MKLIIIAAIARNRVIGNKGKLPWHIPEDFARFKLLTTGHTVLMGRKTFESFCKELPNRRNIVLTSKKIPNVETYTSLIDALNALKNEEKVFIIGGEMLYKETLEIADLLYLTIIHKNYEGDTFFPPYEKILEQNFKLINKKQYDDFSFLDYVRL